MRHLIPLFSGYAMSLVCPMDSDTGSRLPATPPGWVFGLVWPILYLLIGYSWSQSAKVDKRTADLLFGINTILSILWLYLYSCNGLKKLALYDLVAMTMSGLSIMLFANQTTKFGGIALTPYVGWLMFATLLNFTQVNKLN